MADATDTAPLAACTTHIGQVRGALQMLRMQGPTLLCETLEGAVADFRSGKLRPNRLNVPVVDRAVFALMQYLDDLIKGEPNVPIKLFPVYRDLRELAGRS